MFIFAEPKHKTMAASDKSKKGNRVDYARHYSITTGRLPVCGNKRFGYSTNDIKDVDCEKCIKIYKKWSE